MRQVAILFILVGSLMGVQAQADASLEGVVCATPAYEYEYADCYERGLPDATVTLTSAGIAAGVGSQSFSDDTNKNGDFFFDNLASGQYTITVTRDGFEDFSDTLDIPGTDYVAVQMVPIKVTAVLQVVGDDPVANARVSISNSNIYDSANTDSEGFVEFATVSGWHYINVEAPGHYGVSSEFLIDGSETLTLNVEPFPPQTSKVTGVVRDQEGTPVADVRVSSYGYYYSEPRPMPAQEEPEGGSASSDGMTEPAFAPYPCCGNNNWTMTDGQGRYTMHVDAGEVNLQFSKDGHAQKSVSVSVAQDQTVTKDVELLKFPDKDAVVTGKITDQNGNPLHFVQLNIQNAEFGVWECGSFQQEYQECAIQINKDGTFSGTVTPGYTTIRAYFEDWRACTERQDGDGSYHRECGPRYYSFVRTLELESGDNTVNIKLQERPGADATVSGYVVDQDTKQTIVGARVEFSNEATYGYGFGQTDKDGSYKVKLVSGYHTVRVYADGYLPWEGTLKLGTGADAPLDIFLKEGQASYGYCCYYDEEIAYAGSADAQSEFVSPGASPAREPSAEREESGSSSEASAVEDLNGGLGPYDPEARSNFQATGNDDFGSADDKGSSGFGAFAALAALAAAMVLARRRK